MRARALAAGVPLPPSGSFRDAVMQEVLFRERNLRHAEISTVVELLSGIGHYVIDLLPVTDGAVLQRRHDKWMALVVDKLKDFESELYQERYLEKNIRAEAERERKKRLHDLDMKGRDERAMRKVALFSKDG